MVLKLRLESKMFKEGGDLFTHIGVIENGSFSLGDAVEMKVDAEYRSCCGQSFSNTSFA